MIKLTVNQIMQLVASGLFLIGAVFMLVNTFGDASWAFWVGLAFALIGFGVYGYMLFLHRRDIFKKIEYPTESDNIDNHEKNVVTEIQNAETSENLEETKPKARRPRGSK
ncbi:MAG: hypothetical protein FWC00_06430 [Firmicutes bacterium]|nr:hypothetical protein [Bacillota bacterium]